MMALTRKELQTWIDYKPTPQEWELIRLVSHNPETIDVRDMTEKEKQEDNW